MLRKTLMTAGAAGAMLMASPLFAQAHGGGMGHAGGGMPGGMMGGMPGGGMPGGAMGGMNGPMGGMDMGVMHSQGPIYASPVGISHANPNSVLVRGSTTTTTSPTMTVPQTRVRANGMTSYSSNSQASMHSQALLHASPTAIAHASSNSVLARGAVSATTLNGITTGQTVTNSTGTFGTVSNIIYGPNKTTIRAVVVTNANGQTYTLPANSFTSVNGTLTTTYGG